jgi:hypothetical protein
MSNFADFPFISFEKIIIDEDNEVLHGFLGHPQDNTYSYEIINSCMQQLVLLLQPFEETSHIRVVFHWDKAAHSRKIKCKMQHPICPLQFSLLVKWTTQFINEASEHEKILVIVLNKLMDDIQKNGAWQNFQEKKALEQRLNDSFEQLDSDSIDETIIKL